MRFWKLLCPKCQKYLIEVGENATGNIRPYCKRCRLSFNINLDKKPGGESVNGKP